MWDWFKSRRPWSAPAARDRILSGEFPARMRVEGVLHLAGAQRLRALPRRLSATVVNVSYCASLRALPQHLECVQLIARDSALENLPASLQAQDRIDASDCRRLRTVGAYQLRELVLRGCLALERLPEGLQASVLNLSHSPLWETLPASVVRSVEYLDVSECPQLTALPDNFARLQGLNISGCRNLAELPGGIRVRGWIDVADTALGDLPYSLRSVRILWHGVPVADRIAFDPESITAEEILREPNQELRRVLLERMGLDRFFAASQPTVLHEDRDAGGRRRLLRIDLADQEAIVCVQVQCPSTGSKYLLRVPPEMLTCHEAIAWTAGYANPSDYRPAMET
jgi:hypothetical protein